MNLPSKLSLPLLSLFLTLTFALDGYDLLCPKNDLAYIASEVRRCEQVIFYFCFLKIM